MTHFINSKYPLACYEWADFFFYPTKSAQPGRLFYLQSGATFTQKSALKYAWWFESFRAKLRSGIYRFSYFKKDGGIREAVGTLDPSLIPDDILPKSGMDPDTLAPASTFRYYDLIAGGWRSFCIDLFIGFVEEVKSI